MYCKNCGSEVGDNQEVCLKCGVRPLVGGKYCQNCGSDVTPLQELCIKCGVRLIGGSSNGKTMITPTTPPKSPTAAAILSFLFTGIGQIYLGQTLKGLVMLICGIMIGVFTGGLAIPVVWVVTVVDAYKIAKKLQSGRPVAEWEFF